MVTLSTQYECGRNLGGQLWPTLVASVTQAWSRQAIAEVPEGLVPSVASTRGCKGSEVGQEPSSPPKLQLLRHHTMGWPQPWGQTRIPVYNRNSRFLKEDPVRPASESKRPRRK